MEEVLAFFALIASGKMSWEGRSLPQVYRQGLDISDIMGGACHRWAEGVKGTRGIMSKAPRAVLTVPLIALWVACSSKMGVPPTPLSVVPTSSHAAHTPTATPRPADGSLATSTPVATPTPGPISEEGIDISAWEWECVWLTNQLRAQHDLPPLKAEPILMGTARAHSQDMAARGYLDHTSPGGVALVDRLRAAGYDPTGYYGENICVGGQDTPETAIAWWYDEQPPDDPHRRNLLSVNFREIGCGIGVDPGSEFKRYFTQDFGQRSDVFPVVINREAVSTTQRTVALYLYGQSWGAAEMMLSESADFEGATWQPFDPAPTWTFSPDSGPKTVYARVRNAAGETRGPAWDTIQLVTDD